IAIDVTPQVKAKIAIEESEIRFRTMAEGSGIFISTIDVDGKVDYLNKTWMEFTGQTFNNLNNSDWNHLIHPEDLDQVSDIYSKSMSKHQPFILELRLLNAEQRYRWIRLKGAPRFDTNKSFQGYICSGVDFTEEKQQLLEIAHINIALVRANEQLEFTNEKLRHSEENLQSAFNAADLGSCSLDLQTGKAEMSLRYRSLYGLPLEGDIDWGMVTKAVEPEFLSEVNLAMENAMNYGTPVDSTYAIRHLETGERRWMRVAGKVRANEEGSFSHVYAVVMDVTVQKQDEQRKNDFIAMVSHELKTPLTSVTGYAQVLKRMANKAGDLKPATLLDKMELQLKKMSAMINGFLNISRLEGGKIQMDVREFDMSLLIKEIADEFTATTSGHLITYHEVNSQIVVADRDKIGHVVNNLVSNAIKYSGSSSQIEISCDTKEGELLFSITDQGIGVNSQDLPKLFDRYYRVQGSQSTSVSGFGIGLYLSAEIIERHGGRIWAESEPGVGSTFYFSLPL
ncbi:MAG: PAS domain S-box protein, partial [Pedobacter sp.]